MLLKILLWIIGLIAISTMTIFIMYKLAIWIAAALALLAIGAIVGIPLFVIAQYKYRKHFKQMKEELEGGTWQ